MTSEAHLIDTSLFRRAVLGPVLLGFILIMLAASFSHSQLEFCFEVHCFSTFFSLFKFQFAVMGLAIPLGALVASHHRSMQAAAQIRAQMSQNTFSNYIDHKKLFEQFFKDKDPLHLGQISNSKIWSIYDTVFPGAAYGDLSPNPALYGFVIEAADHFEGIANRVKSELDETSLDLSESSIPRLFVNANLFVTDFIDVDRPINSDIIYRDPITTLLRYCDSTVWLLRGLRDCANFHKYFGDYAAIQRVSKISQEMKDELSGLENVNRARVGISDALRNHTESNGELKKQDEYASRALSTQLKEFSEKEKMQRFIEPHDMALVFEHYIPNSHKQVFLDHLPAIWKEKLSEEPEQNL